MAAPDEGAPPAPANVAAEPPTADEAQADIEQPPAAAPPKKPPPEAAPAPPPAAVMKCKEGNGVYEVEGNDKPESATALDTTFAFCGSFSGPADTDYFTFVMPADATNFAWKAYTAAGQYAFTISSEGQTAGPADPYAPWFPGKPYTIRLTSTTASEYYYFQLNITRGGK